MRFTVTALLLLLPLVSGAQGQRYFQESQNLTRSAPTGNPTTLPDSETKPLSLSAFTTYRVSVCPTPGNALTGEGSIRVYLYHPGLKRWGYRKSLDLPLDVEGSVINHCQFFGLRVDVRQGYILPATVGVGVTGGTTVIVRVDPDNY